MKNNKKKKVSFVGTEDYNNAEDNNNAANFNVEKRRSSAQTNAKKSRKTRKIILMGSTESGKTSLVKRFLDNTYTETYTQTIEESYNRDYRYLGYALNLDILDMCSPFQFPVMRDLHIRETDVVMLVYEIDNTKSINECVHAYKKVHELRPSLPITLVGTKLDLHLSAYNFNDGERPKSQYENAEEYETVNSNFSVLHELNLKHVLTSSKDGIRVTEAFELCLDDVVTRVKAMSMSARTEQKLTNKKHCVVL